MPVNRDDILWCYRTLLGREPESEAAVQGHASAADLKALVERFMASDEYRERSIRPQFQPLDLPPIRVDSRVSEPQLAAAWRKVQATWEGLGRTRPHFSVLTDGRFLPDRLPESEQAFWTSGLQEAESVRRVLDRLQVGGLERRVCVEYGCGLGRVTAGLARVFREVHGFDISASHLELARQRAAAVGLGNVRFHHCLENPRGRLPACDFYYSRIVYQHNPPIIIRELIAAALQALRSGGVAMFQVPTYRRGYAFDAEAWLAAGDQPDMEMHCLPQPEIFELVAEAGCRPLEVREDNSTGAPGTFVSTVFVVRKD